MIKIYFNILNSSWSNGPKSFHILMSWVSTIGLPSSAQVKTKFYYCDYIYVLIYDNVTKLM